LDSRTVLTAAHCTDEYPDNTITVNVRRHDLRKSSTEEGGQSIKITRQTRHPEYDDVEINNDVAIWKLASPVTIPVNYVTLDDGNFVEQIDLPAEAIGWGRINPNNDISASRLQHTVLPIYDNQQCSEGYGYEIYPDSQVCAGYSEGISSTCEGDSGGPLFVNQGGRTIQIGITSFGKSLQCLDTGAPTVSILYIILNHIF
jgi:secreted trypsin-like serine protease